MPISSLSLRSMPPHSISIKNEYAWHDTAWCTRSQVSSPLFLSLSGAPGVAPCFPGFLAIRSPPGIGWWVAWV